MRKEKDIELTGAADEDLGAVEYVLVGGRIIDRLGGQGSSVRTTA